MTPTADRRMPSPVTPRAADLGALGMRKGPTSAWQTMRVTARAETRELRSRAGLYLFVPLIVVQIVGGALTALGAFDTPLLLTPGQIAVTQLQQMAVWVSLLLVFYGVESMERERSTRLDAIHDTLPFRTGALLAGKLLSLAVVWLVIALAALLAAFVIVLVQGKVPFSLLPFALLWGLLYLPSFLAFATFVFAAYALTRNRYTTYAVALVALVATLWADLTQRLTWITNWPLWSGLGWSDMSVLEFEQPLIGDERIRAFVIGVDSHARSSHGVSLFDRISIPDPDRAWNHAARF